MTPDIEGLLATAAGGAPPVDLADVARRARRQRTSRAAGLLAACTVIAVVAGSAAIGEEGRDTSLEVVATTLPPTPSETPPPSPSPEPEPEPEPSETPSPTRSPSPAPVTASPPPPTSASDSGRGADGLRAEIEVADTVVAAGKPVTLHVRARDTDGAPYVSWDWGDGTSARGGHFGFLCQDVFDGPPPSSPPPYAGRYDQPTTRAWRTPGRYVVRATVVSDNPCNAKTPREQVTLEVPVEITAGDSSGNGPAEPAGNVTVERREDTGALTGVAAVHAGDADGWVGRVVVDWGDGTKPQTVRTGEPCDDRDGRAYPSSQVDALHVEHEYAEDDEYEVKVTLVSTGCDGRDAQLVEVTDAFNDPPA